MKKNIYSCSVKVNQSSFSTLEILHVFCHSKRNNKSWNLVLLSTWFTSKVRQMNNSTIDTKELTTMLCVRTYYYVWGCRWSSGNKLSLILFKKYCLLLVMSLYVTLKVNKCKYKWCILQCYFIVVWNYTWSRNDDEKLVWKVLVIYTFCPQKILQESDSWWLAR